MYHHFLAYGYTCLFFFLLLFFFFSFAFVSNKDNFACFPGDKYPFKMGSSFEIMNLLLQEQIFFPLKTGIGL